MTQRLTALMGGTLGVHSMVGVGSELWVDFIRAEQPAQEPSLKQRHNDLPLVAAARQQGICTVLYVEDKLANRELVEQILQRRPQVKLLHAVDGAQGLEMARKGLPQVILMDINLPDISGVEVLKILRQDPTTQHIPILAISANAMPGDVVRGLAAGFFRYLTKPIRIHEFLDALDVACAFALDASKHRLK